jgi:hypothetical protein
LRLIFVPEITDQFGDKDEQHEPPRAGEENGPANRPAFQNDLKVLSEATPSQPQ